MSGSRREADELREAARVLQGVAAATATIVAHLAGAWADATGREWAGRLRAVVADLDRRAADALHRADALDRAEEPTGVQLGAQTGVRTTTRRGVVAPTLPAPPP